MISEARIIIGCMSWGSWGAKMTVKEMAEMINFCVENGNRIFDHADIYGDYTTESEFGQALIESRISRQKIKIISKCGIQLVSNNRQNTIKHYNLSKEYIIASVEESLRALRTDYIDTLLLHRPSPLMDASEVADAVSILKESGKIVDFGVSNFNQNQMKLIENHTRIACNQIEFSLTHHEAMHDGLLDDMQLSDIQAMAYSPLGTVYKLNSKQSVRIKIMLSELSKKYTISEDSILLSWILRHPANIFPVIGTTKKQRIKNANQALEVKLELEDWFRLLYASTDEEVA